ncbi:unnamed protein product [Rhizophagus irregularis]|nr:unnamed protein product [Rhizophagus irregularis]
MSFNRRGCVLHQKHIEIYHNTKDTTQAKSNFLNEKCSHTSLLYDRWDINAKKRIYSQRLGISYTTSYATMGFKQTHIYNNDRRMYRKKLDNFTPLHLGKSNTQKKQKSRFERACRSVFHNRGNNIRTRTPITNIDDQLHRARQHRFLFLPSQYIYKPLQHVKYHKRLVLRDVEHYKFPIPSISPMIEPGVITTIHNLPPSFRQDPGNVLTSTSDTHMSTTDSHPPSFKEGHTWHDKLGIMIPTDLFPYITEEPIYVSKRQEKLKGKQHEPGSKGWLDVFYARRNHQDLVEAQNLYKESLSARAKLWGTSVNSIEYREGMVKDLSAFQNHYHEKITNLTDRQLLLHDKIKRGKSVYKTNQQLVKLEKELVKFKIDYSSVKDVGASHHRYKGHTSDDTKELEFRPNKRITPSSTGISRSHDHVKKARSDLLIKED